MHRSVVFFDDRYHEVYGAQENLLLLAQLGQARGWDCRLVTSAEGALAEAARKRGVPSAIIEAPEQLRTFERGTIRGGIGSRLRSLRAWWEYMAAVDRAFRDEPPDVVMAGSVRSAMHLCRLAGRRRGPKTLLFAQNSTPFGLFAAVAALTSDRVLVIAPGAARTFPAPIRWLVRGRTEVLASGRDLSRYEVIERAGVVDSASRTLRVVTVGSVTRRKGLHVLVDAVDSVIESGRPCMLSIVGGTSGADSERYQSEIVAQAERAGVPLELIGWQDDVVPFLAAADVFALASFDEGLPGVLLEAMAAGLPCVTSEAGGSGDLVRAAGGGAVVPVDDAAAFGAALCRLADDPSERRRAGQAGRAHVESAYSLEAYIDHFDAILSDLLDR